MIRLLVALAGLYALPCVAAGPIQIIRLDDQLAHASIKASTGGGNTSAADPVVWQNFFSTADITWQVVRGRAGVRDGDLILKGEGSTPVMLAPKQPAIDWGLYQAVEIRMSAQSGHVAKIKIGDFESEQKLGPAGQYNLYRFPINVDAPKGTRLLGMMPTDSLTDLVAIHSIKLIPKPANFAGLSGHQFLGKQDEYRNAVYVRSPSTITFPVTLPANAHLHFGMGSAARNASLRFHVSTEGDDHDLFSFVVKEPDQWHDGDVDLSRWSGRTIKLRFQTDSDHAGDVALWANPLITSGEKKARPNVLIYTIDTLRADHASVYGYNRGHDAPF